MPVRMGVVKMHRKDRTHPDASAQRVRLGFVLVVVDILQPLPRNRVERGRALVLAHVEQSAGDTLE